MDLQSRVRLGDVEAAVELEQELRRRGDTEGLRRLAWLLIEQGRRAVIMCGLGSPQSTGFCAKITWRSTAPRRLLEPVRVGLLWNNNMLVSLACDCSERVLTAIETATIEYSRAGYAIAQARLSLQGGSSLEALRRASDASWASCAGIVCTNERAGDAAASAGAAGYSAMMALRCFQDTFTSSVEDTLTYAALAALNAREEQQWQDSRLLQYMLGQT